MFDVPNGTLSITLTAIATQFNASDTDNMCINSHITSHAGDAYPMKTKRNSAAVIRAPRDAGDSIPSVANTAGTRHQSDQSMTDQYPINKTATLINNQPMEKM